ncbi:MAG TPA: DUF58 domain-containing protein [Bryobacteraceae bacterium]|nr:DUF58 domain-containing protein [Bryobacteraceae bacterium]
MKPQPLIDSALLEKLERLAIRWQKSFPGLVGGHNISHFAGSGQEFLDHRQFHHGDDLRAVNWRAYLRLEKLFLKMFQVEPRIPVRILLDCSNSMTTGGAAAGAVSKFDYARKLAAALCYVGLVRLDTICIQPFGAQLSDSFLCGGGRHRFIPAVNFLQGLKAEGRTNYFQIAREFISTYPQRGLLIVISDFLDDAGCERPLQYLSDFGHELILVQVWANEDREPSWNGQLDLTDAESGETLEIGFDDAARRNYVEAFDAYARDIQKVGLRNGGRYVGVSTSTTIEEAVFGPLARAGGLE